MKPFFYRNRQILKSRKAFTQTVQMVTKLLNPSFQGNDLDIHKAEVISFFIELIGKDLAFSTASRLLRLGKTPQNVQFAIPAPEEAYVGAENFSLSGINVVSDTYACDKLVGAIHHIKTAGFRQINNYTGTYYPEINLAVIENGRHHLSVAMVHDTGSAQLQICSLRKAFGYVTTDGAFWYTEGGQRQPVLDYRLAVLFELARLRESLILSVNDSELPEPVFQSPNQVNPLNAFHESQFRVKWLELELGIKKLQLDKLRHDLKPDAIEKEIMKLEKKHCALAQKLNAWTENEGRRMLEAYIAWNIEIHG